MLHSSTVGIVGRISGMIYLHAKNAVNPSYPSIHSPVNIEPSIGDATVHLSVRPT